MSYHFISYHFTTWYVDLNYTTIRRLKLVEGKDCFILEACFADTVFNTMGQPFSKINEVIYFHIPVWSFLQDFASWRTVVYVVDEYLYLPCIMLGRWADNRSWVIGIHINLYWGFPYIISFLYTCFSPYLLSLSVLCFASIPIFPFLSFPLLLFNCPLPMISYFW